MDNKIVLYIFEHKIEFIFQLGENVDLKKVDSYKEMNDVLGKLTKSYLGLVWHFLLTMNFAQFDKKP